MEGEELVDEDISPDNDASIHPYHFYFPDQVLPSWLFQESLQDMLERMVG